MWMWMWMDVDVLFVIRWLCGHWSLLVREYVHICKYIAGALRKKEGA